MDAENNAVRYMRQFVKQIINKLWHVFDEENTIWTIVFYEIISES